MKRLGFIAVLAVTIILLSTLAPTQASIVPGLWRDINPTQYSADTTGTLNGIYVRNGGSGAIGAGDGWAVGGDSGTPIIAQYDGFSWQVKANIRTPAVYRSVNFCTSPGAPGLGLCSPNGDGSDGWIVGGNGGSPGAPVAIYWDGSTLTDETSKLPGGATGRLNSVFLVCHFDGSGCPSGGAFGAGVAYAAGTDGSGHGVIYAFNGNPKTVGAWTLEFTTALTATFNGIYMFQNSAGNLEGFAVGGNIVARGVGTTWTTTTLPGAVNLEAVFVASNTPAVWAVGDNGQIWYFNGSVWGLVSPFPATLQNLFGIQLVSTSEGWIVGKDSIILHSTNLGSGNIWTALTNPIQTGTGIGIDLHGVSFPSSGNGWATGTQGVILQTSNSGCGSVTSPCWGGSTSIVQSTSVQSLNSVFELGTSDAWTGGSFDTTSNTFSLIHWDGIKWHRASVTGTPTDVMGIYMSGSGDGWAVGDDTSGHGAMAFHWDGNGWNQGTIATCGASCFPNSVFMTSGGSSGDGWAVGTMGTFWRFQSGSWVSLGAACNSLTFTFNSVFISNSGSSTNAGWAVGNSGTVCILKIVGSTATWSQQAIPGITPAQNLYGVYFKDSNHGWIVGDHGTIVTTNDGGGSWTGGQSQVNGAPATTVLRSVFVDTLGTGSGNADGWAVGDDGSGPPPNPVLALFNGGGWTAIPIAPPLAGNTPPSNLALHSVYVTSPTDGWAVGAGVNYAATPLAGIFHLDPASPPIVHQVTTSTNVVTSTSVVTSSSTTSSSSTSTSAVTTSSATSSVSSASVSTSMPVTSTSSSQTTTPTPATLTVTVSTTPAAATSSSSVTTPMTLPPVPGFPWESIVAGIIVGMSALVLVRRRKR